jgi:ribosomal protein S18 acetylase RimI-like enzyme
MNGVQLPEGYHFGRLAREHRRKAFTCGQEPVDDWLHSKALQQQEKRLSVTKILLDKEGAIAGYYTLATGQVDFGDLPAAVSRHLPRRMLPVAVLAWLGVSSHHQGQGLGSRLLAQALRDCHEAGQIFAFVAVILDCLNDAARAFYQRYNFAELPGHPYRLFLSFRQLESIMTPE